MRYSENALDLEVRIRAHKLYSRATLESILQSLLDTLEDDPVVLDLGCGNGNYFPLFSGKARNYVGVDVNSGLLSEFSKKFDAKKVLIRASMDEMPEFAAGTFDAIFSIYSIYYTEHPKNLVPTLHRFVAKDGKLIVLGPGKSVHAPEIATFIEHASGAEADASKVSGPPKNKNTRTDNFHYEIVPLIESTFASAHVSEVDTSLIFPDAAEWAQYVISTPEVRERFPTIGRDELEKNARRFAEQTNCRSISKTALSLLAHK